MERSGNIARQQTCQRFIYKLHSSRLRKEKWKLSLPLKEARKNNEVISLADSQILRWIDELNGITDADESARRIKAEIKALRKDTDASKNKRKIRKLYSDLDEIQFKSDYVCLIIDSEKDYYRACRGFSINGIRFNTYKRLFGTNGGIKNSCIVFVSDKVYDELHRRIENDRDTSVELVPAKLEAYRALTCSASIPVSFPNGILVVNDCITKFQSDVICLDDGDGSEPVMEERENYEVELNASDGFGLMLPSLSERWSKELGLKYLMSGANTRFAWEKGMVFTFDFLEFADKVAHSYTVTDAWGNEVDIRDVELILTTSMVKLWDSYSSCEDYVMKSLGNGYTFGITKTCPASLESERNLTYQFIQSFQLTDEDIEELIRPTIDEIDGVLCRSWAQTVLFLKGLGLNDRNVDKLPDDIAKAIMIDHRMVYDPFVQHVVYQAIKNRINEAKVGVVSVHGNYSIASGDPFALCQSIFGLEVTGLLRAGEIYNQYWADYSADRLACFRAPMTCSNNVRPVRSVNTTEIRHWFQYMKTCTVFNAWDTSMAALNGMDFDGDLVMLTDNRVLVERLEKLPALMCAQKKAPKQIPGEDALIRSNIESFGNAIGQITNRITSMYEVRSHFTPNSREYKELSYRIRCGQKFQQDEIDKAKGIISNPMPKLWYDRHTVNALEDQDEKDFQRGIVADKKPYFMRYIYPPLMRQYNTYVKNTNRNAMREFRMSVDEMMRLPASSLSERQKEFLLYYDKFMPVGTGDCVMNKICRRFEDAFDGYAKMVHSKSNFDPSIMKSGEPYSQSQLYAIKKLCADYNRRLQNYKLFAAYEHIDECDSAAEFAAMADEFRRECVIACPNEDALCNIVLDICYSRNSARSFAWDMCGSTIIRNLLKKNDGVISYPVAVKPFDIADVKYRGHKFRIHSKQLEVSEESLS